MPCAYEVIHQRGKEKEEEGDREKEVEVPKERVALQDPVFEPVGILNAPAVGAIGAFVELANQMIRDSEFIRAYSHLTLQADQPPALVGKIPELPAVQNPPTPIPTSANGLDRVVPASVPAAIAGMVERAVVWITFIAVESVSRAQEVQEIGATRVVETGESKSESRVAELTAWNEIGPGLSVPGAHAVCVLASGLQGAAMAGTMDKVSSFTAVRSKPPITRAPTPITKTPVPVSRPSPQQVQNLQRIVGSGSFFQSRAGRSGTGGFGVTAFNAARQLAEMMTQVSRTPSPMVHNFWGESHTEIVKNSLSGSKFAPEDVTD